MSVLLSHTILSNIRQIFSFHLFIAFDRKNRLKNQIALHSLKNSIPSNISTLRSFSRALCCEAFCFFLYLSIFLGDICSVLLFCPYVYYFFSRL